jgi:DNA polymerase III alpha subunit (gram-positive type)
MIDIFFDLETAGLEDAEPNIQLAAVAVQTKSWKEVEAFEQKIRFNRRNAHPEALKKNNYIPVVWRRDAKPAKEVARLFKDWLEQFCELKSWPRAFAYNASFDGPRLKRMFKEAGLFLPIDLRVRCVQQRALWYFDESMVPPPQDFKLETVCKHFKIRMARAHDALSDARSVAAVARALSGRGRSLPTRALRAMS